MIKSVKNIVEEEVATTLARLRDQLDDKWITDTGKSKEDLTQETEGDIVRAFANEYFEFLVFGRAPGKHPPVNDMREWVRTKLGITEEKLNKSVAYLVGAKIAKEGTEIYNNRSEGVNLDAELEDLTDRMVERLQGESVNIDIESMINERLKQKFK